MTNVGVLKRLVAVLGMGLLLTIGAATAAGAEGQTYPVPEPPTRSGPPAQAVPPQRGVSLPRTGSDTTTIALVGVGAVAAGAALVIVTRRRRGAPVPA